MPIPVEIDGLGKSEVSFVWEDDVAFSVTGKDLRIRCACAHCVEEGSGRKILDNATVKDDITVTKMELIGNYGVRIEFSDGHGTGIYQFRKLYDEFSTVAS